MASMDPIDGKTFRPGHNSSPGQVFNDITSSEIDDPAILLFLTVDKFGKVKLWNNQRTAAGQKFKQRVAPYRTADLYDTGVIELAIYANPDDPRDIQLGAWLPGNPRVCGT